MECAINGLKINYKVIGEGRPFLILHGWGSASERWERVGEMLAEKGIKAVIPDLPGFGQSEKPKTAWNLDDYCNFVREFVKTLGLQKFYLLGHSFGGEIAIKYSLKFSEKIDKLFLVGAACIRRKTFKKRFFYVLSEIFPCPIFLKKIFYKFIIKSDYLLVEGIMRKIYLKVIKEDLSDILSQVQAPTIIIWGEKDDITPIKDAHLINYKIKDSRLKILVKTGHNPHLECPEKLAELITKFL